MKQHVIPTQVLMDLIATLPVPFTVGDVEDLWPCDQRVTQRTIRCALNAMENAGQLRREGQRRYPRFYPVPQEVTVERSPTDLAWRQWKKDNNL